MLPKHLYKEMSPAVVLMNTDRGLIELEGLFKTRRAVLITAKYLQGCHIGKCVLFGYKR